MADDAPPRQALRVVLDTGVILQAAFADAGGGPATQVLRLMGSDGFQAFISPRLRAEYEAILIRDNEKGYDIFRNNR